MKDPILYATVVYLVAWVVSFAVAGLIKLLSLFIRGK